jgi:hypothetical protein
MMPLNWLADEINKKEKGVRRNTLFFVYFQDLRSMQVKRLFDPMTKTEKIN